MPPQRIAERSPLTRDRVLDAAIELADRDGLEALTMRRLADGLGVEAMSLYYHLTNKNAILDGVIERTFAEIEVAAGGFGVAADPATWKERVRARILAARRVMLRHPWMPAVLESRSTMVPNFARYTDAIVGLMASGGLSHDLIHHAMHALGSRAYGFSQELRMDGDGGADAEANMQEMMALTPHITAMLADVMHDDPESTLGWCDDQSEFEFGLDLLLDGLERRAGSRA
jgi:AcrR family transcriptional regulator